MRLSDELRSALDIPLGVDSRSNRTATARVIDRFSSGKRMAIHTWLSLNANSAGLHIEIVLMVGRTSVRFSFLAVLVSRALLFDALCTEPMSRAH